MSDESAGILGGEPRAPYAMSDGTCQDGWIRDEQKFVEVYHRLWPRAFSLRFSPTHIPATPRSQPSSDTQKVKTQRKKMQNEELHKACALLVHCCRSRCVLRSLPLITWPCRWRTGSAQRLGFCSSQATHLPEHKVERLVPVGWRWKIENRVCIPRQARRTGGVELLAAQQRANVVNVHAVA